MPASTAVATPNYPSDDSGFEALLKPLQEILSKVWDIALTECLEGYLEYIRLQEDTSASCLNFIEAAMLVQNSATFYCKRVDSVHLGCRQFVEKLLNFERGEEHADENGVVSKRKKVQRSLQSDSFDNFGIADLLSDHNINFKPCMKQKVAEKKKLILNKYVKTTTKPNTSIPVYQTKGAEMGNKDEYRLHWCMTSNGLLCEDFDYNAVNPILRFGPAQQMDGSSHLSDTIRDEVVTDKNVSVMDIDVFHDNDFHDDIDMVPWRSIVASPELQPILPVLPSKKAKEIKKLAYDFFIPLSLYVKRKTFTVPQDIIDEVGNATSNWKRRKTDDDKENVTCHSSAFDIHFNFNQHYELTVLPDYKIKQSLKIRKKELFLRRLANAKAVKNAAEDYQKDFLGFGEDIDDGRCSGCDGDFDELPPDIGLLPAADPNTQDNSNTFEQNMALTMQQYQIHKRNNAKELTEVAKRVAAWHESLQSMLEMAESRSHFNIHCYGTHILDKFPDTSQSLLDFSNIVTGEKKAEISRYLLSTLMLANTYNVEIILSKEGSLRKDCLQLKLLSKVRHHEEMDEEMENIRH